MITLHMQGNFQRTHHEKITCTRLAALRLCSQQLCARRSHHRCAPRGRTRRRICAFTRCRGATPSPGCASLQAPWPQASQAPCPPRCCAQAGEIAPELRGPKSPTLMRRGRLKRSTSQSPPGSLNHPCHALKSTSAPAFGVHTFSGRGETPHRR